ncbi:MAG TPA: hypothetical protein VFI28_10085 [Candidatus Limnocylindrales bacterium]|nr:hypothetical protein [Candidatus Limnocylindrales bacterium]
MDRRIVHGPSAASAGDSRARSEAIADHLTLVVGVGLVLFALVVYVASNPNRGNFYNHFVWQASAWLDGQATIPYPVGPDTGLPHSNEYFQDVLAGDGSNGIPVGRALLPFPPLPAVVLVPFVAAFGLATDAQLLGAVIGALDVGLAFWVLGRLRIGPSVRVLATLFFGFGTVFWYTAMLGTTWYLAHLVAVGLTFGSIAVALDGDPRAIAAAAMDGADAVAVPPPPSALSSAPGSRPRGLLDRRQVAAGFLLGLAATARLTVGLGLPFLFLVGAGTWRRRAASAAVGAAIPLTALGIYNLVTSGHAFNPAYEAIWATEIRFYPPLYPYLQYHLDWAIEDPRYVPQNLVLMLTNLPRILPACDPGSAGRALFDPSCPLVIPRDDGMGLLWTSPGWLLALTMVHSRRGRLVTGALAAVGLIALANLMHFSQGWVQFGYRFSNDFAPFLLLVVAIGIERLGGLRWFVLGLVGLSVIVNWWGVVWGVTLGW